MDEERRPNRWFFLFSLIGLGLLVLLVDVVLGWVFPSH
jgi:nitrogen fixation/metabolism regulation signal transduction histidine kinase